MIERDGKIIVSVDNETKNDITKIILMLTNLEAGSRDTNNRISRLELSLQELIKDFKSSDERLDKYIIRITKLDSDVIHNRELLDQARENVESAFRYIRNLREEIDHEQETCRKELRKEMKTSDSETTSRTLDKVKLVGYSSIIGGVFASLLYLFKKVLNLNL